MKKSIFYFTIILILLGCKSKNINQKAIQIKDDKNYIKNLSLITNNWKCYSAIFYFDKSQEENTIILPYSQYNAPISFEIQFNKNELILNQKKIGIWNYKNNSLVLKSKKTYPINFDLNGIYRVEGLSKKNMKLVLYYYDSNKSITAHIIYWFSNISRNIEKSKTTYLAK
jgi:hypothetical protein